MSRGKKQKNYNFVISGVNLNKIYKQYKLELDTGNQRTTLIDELIMDKSQKMISFVNEDKIPCKCVVHTPNLNSTGKLSCYWCRNPIPMGIKPLGCPIRYVPNQIIKTYFSEFSKDFYKIKENILNTKFLEINKLSNDDNYVFVENGYYILDGIFCSFNCCMAYIEDNSELSLFKNSHTLLLKFYNDIFSDNLKEIDPAPHWKKLVEYGGELTIDQFRNNFSKIDYIQHGINISIPKNVSIGYLFEEKIKF